MLWLIQVSRCEIFSFRERHHIFIQNHAKIFRFPINVRLLSTLLTLSTFSTSSTYAEYMYSTDYKRQYIDRIIPMITKVPMLFGVSYLFVDVYISTITLPESKSGRINTFNYLPEIIN